MLVLLSDRRFPPRPEVPETRTHWHRRPESRHLDLGGGKLGGSPEDIQIIVKTGSELYRKPASGGLTRPDGNTGSYFKWRGSNGKLYAPGDNVPADVTRLTAQFDSDTYTVTIITEGGGTASASYAKAVFGTEIILTATPDTGYHFKMWQVESPAGLVITNGRFTMPDNNVRSVLSSRI